jgi:molecular chaperone GrpE
MSSKHNDTREGHPAAPLEASSESDRTPAVVAVDSAGSAPEEGAARDADEPKARIASLEAEIGALREEVSSLNDKYLRKLADDVNFRKRMAREKEDGQRFAVAALLGDLVPVLDDFDRAIASAEVAKEYSVLHDGVALIRRQLGQVLESKYGLTKLESLGKSFDPNRHEAVAVVQGGPEDGEEAIVAEEYLPGYGLHDRILRTAKVRVRMPALKGAAPSDGAAGADPAPAPGGAAS